MISPYEMMKLLHTAFPARSQTDLRWASLEMLKSLYQENPADVRVQAAQVELKAAGSQWNDEQVKDFLVNHLLEPPHSTEASEKSASELRATLWAMYHYLFEEK